MISDTALFESRVLRRAGLRLLVLACLGTGINAQVWSPAENGLRIQTVGQALTNDIDYASTALDDAFRSAIREAALTLALPSQVAKIDPFVSGLTREQASVFCYRAEPSGPAAFTGSTYRQAAIYTIRTEVLNQRLALASVGVKSLVGLPQPPRLFLAISDTWNPSGDSAKGWIGDGDLPSHQQILETLKARHSSFPISDASSLLGGNENRSAMLARARREGAELLIIGSVRSHQMTSPTDSSAQAISSARGGLTSSGLSDPNSKLTRLSIGGGITGRARIAVDVDWRILDTSTGNTVLTISGRRDPAPGDPSDARAARRNAKSVLVAEKVDELWVRLVSSWNQQAAVRSFTIAFGALAGDQSSASLASRLREAVASGPSDVVLRSTPDSAPVFGLNSRLDISTLATNLEAAFAPRWRIVKAEGIVIEFAPAQGAARVVQAVFTGLSLGELGTVQEGISDLLGVSRSRRLPVSENKVVFVIDTTLRDDEIGTALESLLPGRLQAGAIAADRIELKITSRTDPGR